MMNQIGFLFCCFSFFPSFSRGNVESYYIFRKNVFETQGMVGNKGIKESLFL